MYFLIGHRGVGKTEALKAVDGGIDLDEEILKEHDIHELLSSGQEKKFREIEQKCLFECLRKLSPKVVALGAGFELDKFEFPKNAVFIWLQRKSDQIGRVFLDRPRLDAKKTQIQEFTDRKQARDEMYALFANFRIESEEGGESVKTFKRVLGGGLYGGAYGFVTINKESELKFLLSYKKIKIELRTDTFEESVIQEILLAEKDRQVVVALRKEPTSEFMNFLKKITNDSLKILVDIPVDYVEKGCLQGFKKESVFISEHDFISIEELKRFNKAGYHVKWAPEVESFEELVENHHAVKNLDVSFLPRSVGDLSGRWNWYRQITFLKNKITFFRYGLNDYIDQPSHYELEGSLLKGEDGERGQHGAVIGSDVDLSHSPSYHRLFIMENFKGTYFKISLYQDEFSKENLDFLSSLGIKFGSVSSPFKDELGAAGGYNGPANTFYMGDHLEVLNTDVDSVDRLVKQLKKYSSVLVWGAGATGKIIADRLGSKAALQSVRQYDEATTEFGKDFDVLVWCAGSECLVSPNLKVKPLVIFDIEYKEHSRAKAVALSWGCEYISGADFFTTQAKAQQKFWLSYAEDQI